MPSTHRYRAKRMITRGLLALVLAAGAATSARADVTPASVFTDHMVLQRDKPLAVWGKGAPGEEVTVSIAGQSKQSKTNQDGNWTVTLDPLPANSQATELTIKGNNSVVLRDVLVGEVWICSGQSNMEWRLDRTANAEQAVAAANQPRIRLFNVSAVKKPSTQPVVNVAAKWQVCTPQTVRGFSAVGYYFGVELQQKLDVPIGLINSSWGGMPAEAFTPVEKLTDPALKSMLDDWEKMLAAYPAKVAKYEQDLAAWKRAVEDAHASGQPEPKEPARPAPAPDAPSRPGNLWNGLIYPLVPYGVRGAIWYQGESNADRPERAKQYATLLPVMIGAWREAFGQGDFPFLVVQLANFKAPTADAGARADWAILRESQRQTALTVKNVGMAVIIDIGEEKDIHPRNKLDVGKRLALLALADTYGVSVPAKQGPTLQKATFDGGKVTVHFSDIGGGLVAKEGSLANSFAITGADGKWHWADAKIEGNTVVLSSPEVKEPAAIRYAWADNPKATLFNKEGLPASPFEEKK